MIISRAQFLVKSGLAGLALVNTLSARRLKEKSGKRRAAYIGMGSAIIHSGYRQKNADRPNLHPDNSIKGG